MKSAAAIKSTVALMTTACTDDDGSVDALLSKYSRLEKLTEEDREWMQCVVLLVRDEIKGPLPLKLTDPVHIPSYLPFLRKILLDIEGYIQSIPGEEGVKKKKKKKKKAVDEAEDDEENKNEWLRGIKAFSLLPQKQFRAPFIHISNTVLRALLTALRGKKRKREEEYDVVQAYVSYLLECEDDNDQLWRECFRVETVAKGRKRFAGSIKTDGISVSVTVEVPIVGDPLPSKGRARKSEIAKREKAAAGEARREVLEKWTGKKSIPERIVAIDPGVKSPFTGVVHNAAAMNTLPDENSVHFETFSWSARKYYDECGFTRRISEMKKWTAAAPDVQNFNSTISSGKTASLAAYSQRVAQVLEGLPMLMNFYVHKKRVRRSRWYGYMRRQKASENMIEEVTATRDHQEQKRVLVAYGNAAMHNMRGTRPVVQKAFRRKLARRCMLVDVDEFRTSKLCCCCSLAMKGKLMEGVKRRSYGVRHCENSACHRTYWNRDVNAAINILRKCLRFLNGEEEPGEFLRPAPA